MNKITSIIILMITLSGCATATGPVFKEQATQKDSSVIFLYREMHMVGGAMSVDVTVNNKMVTSLANDGYFPYVVAPGKTNIVVSSGIMSNSINITTEANKQYYVRTGGIYGYQGIAIGLRDADEAKKEIIKNSLKEDNAPQKKYMEK
mgnify:CR=1 FL=1